MVDFAAMNHPEVRPGAVAVFFAAVQRDPKTQPAECPACGGGEIVGANFKDFGDFTTVVIAHPTGKCFGRFATPDAAKTPLS